MVRVVFAASVADRKRQNPRTFAGRIREATG
jgi:hypothetical protein